MSLFRRWRNRQQQFWQRIRRRDAAVQGPVLLDRHRIYVLPTRAGLVYLLVLFAMWLAATNYNNNLGHALVYLLTGLGLTAILHSFRNLHGLHLRAGRPTPVFAGEQLHFPLSCEDGRKRTRLAITVDYGDYSHSLDLDNNHALWAQLPHPSHRRGRVAMGRITISTRFPLGLIRAWSYLHLDMQGLVYPAPAPSQPLPTDATADGQRDAHLGRQGDDFAGLRNYQPGDSLRHVHWKAVAKGQSVPLKQFGGNRDERLVLDWEATPGAGTEERLSLLCRWALDAEQQGLPFALRLPGIEIPLGNGEAHLHQCLESLALFGLPATTAGTRHE